MKVTLLSYPTDEDLKLVLRAIWLTMGKMDEPKKRISSDLLHKILVARHSPIRMLNFCFLIDDIPSNISVHLCRHIHAVPFVQSLRNDRQDAIDGDLAPRNTPINMMYYCNAEELMTIANKRLCGKASFNTQYVVAAMCREALKVMPELEGTLIPMCQYHGGVCQEIQSCGRCKQWEA